MASEAKVVDAKVQEVANRLAERFMLTPFQKSILQGLVDSGDKQLKAAIQAFPNEDQSELLLREVQNVMLESLEKLWDDAFVNCSTSDGKKISKAEREAMNIAKSSLVYGEVSFQSLGRILWSPLLNLKPGGVFYDLGSGTGRGVIGAALLHDFDKLVGIEILQGLTDAANDVLKVYDKHVRPKLSERQKKAEIKFVKGNFLEYDWSDADVVFANSTCFDEDLVEQIGRLGEKLKEGAIVITLTKRLHNPWFRLIWSKQMTMSWGYATVNIHERAQPQSAAASPGADVAAAAAAVAEP